MEELGGWSERAGKSSESDYGDGHSLKQLKEAIDKLHSSEIDLESLSRDLAH